MAFVAMAKCVVLVQFLAAVDKKYQSDENKTLILIDWVEDVAYLICKLADCTSWKRQLVQNARWLWFQCVRHLSNVLSSYFNFAPGPEVNSIPAKDTMPAKDDRALEDIADSFQQLCRDIKSAIVNGDGHPLLLTDSNPPLLHVDRGLPNKRKAESAKLSIADHPVQPAALLSPQPRKKHPQLLKSTAVTTP
jgi:hypothetical protein